MATNEAHLDDLARQWSAAMRRQDRAKADVLADEIMDIALEGCDFSESSKDEAAVDDDLDIHFDPKTDPRFRLHIVAGQCEQAADWSGAEIVYREEIALEEGNSGFTA